MYLIIRLNAMDTYTSECFGILKDESGEEYYVVLNRDYSNLELVEPFFRYHSDEGDYLCLATRCFALNNKKPDWVVNGSNLGYDFIVNEENVLEALFSHSQLDADTLKRVVDIHKKFEVKPWYEVKTEGDADNLTSIARNFHDAYISSIKVEGEYTIFTFDTSWEYFIALKCDSANLSHNLRLEDKTIWFDGDITYNEDKISLKTNEVILGEENGSIECKKMYWQLIPQPIPNDVWEQIKKYALDE